MIKPSWVRWQSADPIREAWENRRERRMDDPFEIERALDMQPLGRPTFPSDGPREKWYLAIDQARAERLLAGEPFDLYTVPFGYGFPVARSRGVQVLPDAERELVIDAPQGMCNGRRAYLHFGHVIVLMDGEDLFQHCTISEARPIATGGTK